MENSVPEGVTMIPGGGKDKKTVLGIQKMKGKEQIVMFCTWDMWIAAAAEMAGCHILRFPGMASRDNAEARAAALPFFIRDLRSVAPNILLNPFVEPYIVSSGGETLLKYSTLLMEAGGDIVLTLAITLKNLEALSDASIPVFCHVGLTPTWYTTLTGGYVRVGKTAEDALTIFQRAYDYQEAGAKMITTEMTSREVTSELAKRLRIPVLSIAGGAGGDGAELVCYDLLGMSPLPIPKHAKQYRQFFNEALGALGEYVNDVKTGAYPDEEKNSWSMKPEEHERFMEGVERICKR